MKFQLGSQGPEAMQLYFQELIPVYECDSTFITMKEK